MIKGHASSAICSSAYFLTSYLTCLHTTPCHTMLQEARDSGLLAGHARGTPRFPAPLHLSPFSPPDRVHWKD